MQKFKVAIIGEMPANGYSGGRYHAWVMAEALAHSGNRVYMITNHLPQFSHDFEAYPNHKQIQVVLIRDFYYVELKENNLDYVICVPGISEGGKFYHACLHLAVSKNARFAFINFETPNWYHDVYAKLERPEKDYKILKKICKYGCLVLSSAKESQKYAVKYYKDFPKRTEHCVWSPPINSIAADSITEEKENQIMVFLRVRDKHKGGDDFLQLLGEYLRGMTCVCVIGTGEIDKGFLNEAQAAAERDGICLEFKKSLNDYQKFQEMKKSKLLLFPSHFEGYGYPPVEALYCGTKCIVYDLPVLREISGDALTYCEIDNLSMMRKKTEILLKKKDIEPICVDTAEFSRQADRLQHILKVNYANPKLKNKRNFWEKALCSIKRTYYTSVKDELSATIKYCIENGEIISTDLKNSNETWRKIKRQIQGKRIYIWGCGKLYAELYPKYKDRIEVQGIIDSDIKKIGNKDNISGMIIQSPDILRKVNKKSTVVFISNKRNVDAIIDELKGVGIKRYHSLCMIEMNSPAGKIHKFLNRLQKMAAYL